MPTTFTATVFVVLTTLNSAGELAPGPNGQMPSGTIGNIFTSMEQCHVVRGRMEHPEKAVCQEFRGPKTTSRVPTDGMPPDALATPPAEVKPTPRAPEVKPQADPTSAPGKPPEDRPLSAEIQTPVMHAAVGRHDWPAMSTQVIALGDYKELTNESCRNHVLSVMSDLSLNNLGVSGENTTYGIITVQDHSYAITVRCQVEHRIVVFIVAGASLANAHKAMMLFQQAWVPPIPPLPRQEPLATPEHKPEAVMAVGPTKLRDADKPYLEPAVAAKLPQPKADIAQCSGSACGTDPADKPLDITPKAPTPKRVAERQHRRREAMFEGNPFTGFFSW